MLIAGSAFAFMMLMYSAREYYNRPRTGRFAARVSEQHSSGLPRIGGDFSLVDQDGNPVTWADLRGSWVGVYFGFIRCPEVCPAQMAKMSQTIRLIKDNVTCGDVPWTFVFVSCDPARDNIGLIKEYLADFEDIKKSHNVRILGLVGTPEMTAKAMSQWRIYASVPDDQDTASGEYIVDHSIACYWFDPRGRFTAMHGPKYRAEQMAAELVKMVDFVTANPDASLY